MRVGACFANGSLINLHLSLGRHTTRGPDSYSFFSHVFVYFGDEDFSVFSGVHLPAQERR